jgi:hypothetical protein
MALMKKGRKKFTEKKRKQKTFLSSSSSSVFLTSSLVSSVPRYDENYSIKRLFLLQNIIK